tara:strand:+ start:132 stop:287 length:156 start_codon:yes stop_codon:yes gene_type:complete
MLLVVFSLVICPFLRGACIERFSSVSLRGGHFASHEPFFVFEKVSQLQQSV